MTVAKVRVEAELSSFENSHKCNPIRLYQLSQYPYDELNHSQGMASFAGRR
jgi:hypothetical protein